MKDIRTLDLNLLRTLDALLDERSVTKAAQRLGLTQPAVSGMLTRLRESFEDPLFVRAQRGIVPTLRATQLMGPLKQILADVERLFQPSVFEPSLADFTVAVAASDYALVAVVVPFLAQLRLRAPGIRVAIRSADNDRIQAQFESGDVDLALITPEEAPPDLHARGLFDERYVCALRTDHPDVRSAPLTLDRFCELDHALVSYSGQQFRGATDDALTKVGRARRVVLSVNSFMALAEVLRRTDLIAVVPRRLVSDGDGLVTFEPPVDIPGFTKLAVWHERTHRDPGHRWVRSILFEACGALERE
ncbi:LysR family transcriptional regulator [Rhizobium sp. YTU87027]|uniref:LysR family transcriptional regulator n=1 Tax=Rhizobium sp. YTU87027 TaxID=3417741 RepID=UPI003D6977CB